jgi:hypothetical protein
MDGYHITHSILKNIMVISLIILTLKIMDSKLTQEKRQFDHLTIMCFQLFNAFRAYCKVLR